ncbi:MAG TPA: hypothetical protein VNE63_20745, partial [Candidatus Acidoferrales bacterium]|nr:hypothetical protein [Candidatus Acidoferrales bacterium]
HTPVLQYHFNWKTLSVIAGIRLWNFYFRLYPGAIHAPHVVAFLKHLLRHIPGKLLLVWDRLPAHRSRVVQLLKKLNKIAAPESGIRYNRACCGAILCEVGRRERDIR